MQDPIADMITRIRNAQRAGHETVEMPASKFKVAIAKLLQDEGYVESLDLAEGAKPVLNIALKYFKGKPVIELLDKVSKSGLRVYRSAKELPTVMGGLGVAVFDQLLTHGQTKHKVVAINNASRALDIDKNRSKKILKEDLYLNLLHLMERKQIFLLKDSEIFTSLKSIMCESTDNTNDIRIYGKYTHIAEGLIRAAWAERARPLNIYFEIQ
jgi:small subunit ribosomal protein S8